MENEENRPSESDCGESRRNFLKQDSLFTAAGFMPALALQAAEKTGMTRVCHGARESPAQG